MLTPYIYMLCEAVVKDMLVLKCCGHMNLLKPMRKNNYVKLSHRIRDSAQNVAERSMATAAAEVKLLEGNSDVGVSIDGTWQKREFTSLNGVVAAISITNGKILDLEAITRYCNVCETKGDFKKRNREELDTWKEQHQPSFKANYQGSAPNMEST